MFSSPGKGFEKVHTSRTFLIDLVFFHINLQLVIDLLFLDVPKDI